MSEEYGENIESRRSITEKYRLAVIDEENLVEVKSFRVSLLNIYTLISTLVILIGIAIISLIFYTPMKRFVPGYGDVDQNVDFLKLRDEVNEMEKALEIQELYNQSLRKMIKGEISDDILLEGNTISLDVKDQGQKNTKIGTISPEEIGDVKSTKILGSLFFVTPVTGSISSGYLGVKSHLGVDVLAPKDSAIKSIMSGMVVFSEWTMESGNTIVIQHSNDIVSIYKHNSILLKKAGGRIEAGEAIAIIGNSGTLTNGPHLHFELWYDGYPVDPEKFINFN